MAQANQELLKDAVARNTGVVLSLPSAGILRHHKSRFLAENDNGYWVEADASEKSLIEELKDSGNNVGISFKQGHNKIIFASRLLEYDPEFRVNDQITVPAIQVAPPEQIKSIQRRNNYRVKAQADCELAVRIWRIAPRAYLNDRPSATQEVKISLRDFSLGGIGVAIHGENGLPPKISTEDRLRVEMRYREIVIVLEGRMRQPAGPQPNLGIHSGIQFKEMSNDLEGRQKMTQLNKILGDMQREEVRRARLGL